MSTNARCTGCMFSGVPSPSTVVTSRSLHRDGEQQAGVDPPAVQQHRARAALAVVATLLGAGQPGVLAQRVEQRGAVVEVK